MKNCTELQVKDYTNTIIPKSNKTTTIWGLIEIVNKLGKLFKQCDQYVTYIVYYS